MTLGLGMKTRKASTHVFNVGPTSARHLMAFRWRADDGPFIVYLDPTSPYQVCSKDGPRLALTYLTSTYRILTWWPSWSCDQIHLHKFSSPCPSNLSSIDGMVSEKIY